MADEWRKVEFKLIGMATVFKRDKIWWANIKAWDDKTQKYRWVKRSTKLTNKDKALAVAALLEEASQEQKTKGLKRHDAEQLVNDILRMAGGEGVSKCEPVGQFVQQFIDFKKRTVKPKTTQTSIAHLNMFLSHFDKEKRLDEFTANEMQNYYQTVLLNKFELSTARNHVTSIRRWFNRAVELNEIKHNPAAAIDLLEETTDEKHVFTKHEIMRLIKVMLKEKRRDWVALTLLGWHSGARIQDCLQCNKQSIIKLDNVIGWRYAWEYTENKKKGKGKVLIIPLPNHVVKLVKPGFKSIRDANNYNGKISEDFIEWLKKANIDPIKVTRKKRDLHLKSFHSFRHTMQTRLAAANVSDRIARMVTGHDSAQVARRYTHNDVNAVANALKVI